MTSDDIQKRLGENVKRIRKEQNLTQFQLAEKAELSEETVKNIELSRCWTSDKNLAKITKALGVDISFLFLPVQSSFNEDSEKSIVIKKAIADNLKSYIDTAVGSGGTASAEAIAQAKQEAINTSKTYTDTALTIVEF